MLTVRGVTPGSGGAFSQGRANRVVSNSAVTGVNVNAAIGRRRASLGPGSYRPADHFTDSKRSRGALVWKAAHLPSTGFESTAR